MSGETLPSTDPVALVESLEPGVLRTRIAELDRQARALKILLRAAVAREKRRTAPTPVPTGGGPHAA
jgi:hypothetical protein